ncbi:unnamed protein product, partial [Allacma fusca]
MKANFSINDMAFESHKIRIEHHEALDPIFTVKTNWIFQAAVNWTSLKMSINVT